MKITNAHVAPKTLNEYYLEAQRYLPRGVSAIIKRSERRHQRHTLKGELPSLQACLNDYYDHVQMQRQSHVALKLVKPSQPPRLTVAMKTVIVMVTRKKPFQRCSSEICSVSIPLMAA